MLAILRGISIFLICLLLSSFLINRKVFSYEKPVVVIISDNSRSVLLQKDSAYFQNEYRNDIRHLTESLEKSADVQSYEFDSDLKNNITFKYDGDQTDLYNAIDNIIVRYEGRNIAGMILITDGIVNSGNDPSILNNNLYFPVYSVALGDTSSFADAMIKSVRYNKSAGFGNRFPIEIVVHSTGLNGQQTNLIIKQDGQEIARDEIRFSSGTFSETKTFIFEANKKGLLRFEFFIEPLENEKNTTNNFASAVVQVIDKKNKVAILFQSPHPDISAIKSVLEEARNYDIELISINAFNSSLIREYDAFILYQLPDKKNRSNVVEQIVTSSVPYILFVGQNSDLRQLSQLNTGLRIQQTSQTTQEALPIMNSSFSLFQILPDLQRKINTFPPVITHFGNYSLNENFQVLLYQKIGNVQTSSPMLAFSTFREKISAIFIGEGIFKWKLYDYYNNDNHLAFNEIFQKTCNLLVQQSDKRRLRVHHKDVYFSTENVEISAEVYNMAMELITSARVNFLIKNKQGLEKELLFSPQISDYKLNLGRLYPGHYEWKASTQIDNELLEESGLFFVEEILIEHQNTKADHNLLKFLSSESDGHFFTIDQIKNVAEHVKENNVMKELEYVEEKTDDLISFKWILILLIVFLTAEWATRKFLGSY